MSVRHEKERMRHTHTREQGTAGQQRLRGTSFFSFSSRLLCASRSLCRTPSTYVSLSLYVSLIISLSRRVSVARCLASNVFIFLLSLALCLWLDLRPFSRLSHSIVPHSVVFVSLSSPCPSSLLSLVRSLCVYLSLFFSVFADRARALVVFPSCTSTSLHLSLFLYSSLCPSLSSLSLI